MTPTAVAAKAVASALKPIAIVLPAVAVPHAKIIELLQKRFKNQLSRIEQLNSEDAYQLYMNTLTQLFDPHTNYLSPANSENFNINMSLQLEGIGAVLQSEDEHTKVVRLVAGSLGGPGSRRPRRPGRRLLTPPPLRHPRFFLSWVKTGDPRGPRHGDRRPGKPQQPALHREPRRAVLGRHRREPGQRAPADRPDRARCDRRFASEWGHRRCGAPRPTTGPRRSPARRPRRACRRVRRPQSPSARRTRPARPAERRSCRAGWCPRGRRRASSLTDLRSEE